MVEINHYLKKLTLLQTIIENLLEYHNYFSSILEFYHPKLNATKRLKDMQNNIKDFTPLEINVKYPIESLKTLMAVSNFLETAATNLHEIFAEINNPQYYNLLAVNMSYTYMEKIGALKGKISAELFDFTSMEDKKPVNDLLHLINKDYTQLIELLLNKDVSAVSMQILIYLKSKIAYEKLLPYIEKMMDNIIPHKLVKFDGTLMSLKLLNFQRSTLMLPKDELYKKYNIERTNKVIVYNTIGSAIAYDIKNTLLDASLKYYASSGVNDSMIRKFSNVKKLAQAPKDIVDKVEIVKLNAKNSYILLETFNGKDFSILDKNAVVKNDTITINGGRTSLNDEIDTFLSSYHENMYSSGVIMDKDFVDVRDAFLAIKPIDMAQFKSSLSSLIHDNILRMISNKDSTEIKITNVKEILKDYYDKSQGIITNFLIESSNFSKNSEYSLTNFVKIYTLITDMNIKMAEIIQEYPYNKNEFGGDHTANYLDKSLGDMCVKLLNFLDERKKLTSFISMSLKDVYLSKKIL